MRASFRSGLVGMLVVGVLPSIGARAQAPPAKAKAAPPAASAAVPPRLRISIKSSRQSMAIGSRGAT